MATIIIGQLAMYKPNPKNVLDRAEISLVAVIGGLLLFHGIVSMIVGMTGNDYMDLLEAINVIINISLMYQRID